MATNYINYFKQLMEILSTNPDLRKTIKGMCKQAAYSGTGALIGAVVGGPVGGFFGSLTGAAIGYMLSDDYDSMIQVLMNMSDSEKQRLVQGVQELVRDIGIDQLKRFIKDPTQREKLLRLIKSFIKTNKR